MARRTHPKKPPDAATRILVLHGPDEARRRDAVAQLRAAMDEAHGRTDIIEFDGKTCELADVFDELRSFGLMQQYKIVTVNDAESFVTAHRAALEKYAAKPEDHATLLLHCGRWFKGNLDKKIAKVGQVTKCEPMSPGEIKTRLIDIAKTQHQRVLGPPAAQLLIDRLGPDLLRLENELAKLCLLIDAGQAVTAKLIDQVTGRGSDEQAWAVQEAVLAVIGSGGSGGQAIEKIHELVELSRQADVLVGYFVADLMRKLYLARQMLRQGTSPGQISSAMKLWGPRQAAFMGALDRVNESNGAAWFDQVITADRRAKSGLGKSLRNIECFCAGLTDNNG